MKIMHLLTSNAFSGAENVVCQIINSLKSEYNIESIYCSPVGPIKDTLRDKGIPYMPIINMKIKDVKEAVKTYKPDIIHAHGTTAAVIVSMACWNAPIIFHIHNNSLNSRCLSIKSIANLLPFFRSRHLIWVTQNCLECYKFASIVKHKSTVINNGIDLSLFSNSRKKTDENKLIMVSRFAPAKDQATVIRAMPLIDERFHLFFVGDGEKRQDSETLVKQLNLMDRVHFLGTRTDIPQIVGDAFIGIQSSLWEGFGMSAVEIMASGIPVIASDADGLKQVVEGAGLIFKTRDEVDLANKIMLLASDKSLYKNISDACLERAKKYSIEGTSSKCFEIYKSIVNV